jgi:hypothetical protein
MHRRLECYIRKRGQTTVQKVNVRIHELLTWLIKGMLVTTCGFFLLSQIRDMCYVDT